MLGNTFYYGSIRKVIVAFGSLFSDILIERDGESEAIPVPLQYNNKEKFFRRLNMIQRPHSDAPHLKEVLPAMGFEMTFLSYAPERKTNTMHRIRHNNSPTPQFMYNRVPYNMEFVLYIATRKMDDSLRIIEQILPYFTPEFQVKIKEKEDFDIDMNIPIVLNSVEPNIIHDGTMDDGRRTILWSLSFTAKAHLYADTNNSTLIKKAIVDFSDPDTDRFFESYMAEVVPITANEDEPHTIRETISEVARDTYDTLGYSGGAMELDTLE